MRLVTVSDKLYRGMSREKSAWPVRNTRAEEQVDHGSCTVPYSPFKTQNWQKASINLLNIRITLAFGHNSSWPGLRGLNEIGIDSTGLWQEKILLPPAQPSTGCWSPQSKYPSWKSVLYSGNRSHQIMYPLPYFSARGKGEINYKGGESSPGAFSTHSNNKELGHYSSMNWLQVQKYYELTYFKFKRTLAGSSMH